MESGTIKSRCHAPQPHVPEASDAISHSGRSCGGVKKETPFHSATKACHHARSDRNATLRRTGTRSRCGPCPACRRSIIRRRKERPALTTLHAWLSNPTRDSRSLREHTLRFPPLAKERLKASQLIRYRETPGTSWDRPSCVLQWEPPTPCTGAARALGIPGPEMSAGG